MAFCASLFCANIPNFLILETLEDYDLPCRGDLMPRAPTIRNGYYEARTGPGWGVEIDGWAIAAHAEDPNAKMNEFVLYSAAAFIAVINL